MKEVPSSIDLIREAATTKDAERQKALANWPSDMVRHSLSKNPYLTPEAKEFLQNKVDQLRAEAAQNALDASEIDEK